jgi:hypothetical protein
MCNYFLVISAKNFRVNGDPVAFNTVSASLLLLACTLAKAPYCCWRQRCSVFNVHASAAEIHPAVANNLSAVSVPGAIVVAFFPAVADAQVFCCCWLSYSGTAVYPTVADVLAVVGSHFEAGVSMVHGVPIAAGVPAVTDSLLPWDSLLFLASLLLLESLLSLESLLLLEPPLHRITCCFRRPA